jgi:hypothetical protein
MSYHLFFLLATFFFACAMSSTQAFTFVDNSHAMLEAVCQRTPWFVRSMARKNIHKSLAKHLSHRNSSDNLDNNNNEAIVTEDLMYTVCKEVTPSLYLAETLQILDSLKTKPLN